MSTFNKLPSISRKALHFGVLFLILLQSFPAVLSAQYCPNADVIRPCLCNSNFVVCNPRCENEITCCNLNDETLRGVVQNNTDIPFSLAKFCQLRVSNFPASSFASKQFRNLKLRDCNFNFALFDSIPPPGNNLEQLELINLKLPNGIEWNLLSNFPGLTSLTIQRVLLPVIDDSFAQSLSRSLVNLEISQTLTNTLGDLVFAPFSNLVKLSVSNTEIKTVKRSMFPNPSKLVMLSLSNNKIDYLPEDLWSGMNSITRVELDGNQISTLPYSLFGRSPPMSIDVGRNPVNCDCKMKWMSRKGWLPHLSGVCALPFTKSGKGLYGLGFYDFREC